MNDKIYIIGHKAPDLDSVAAAIAYADYKNAVEKTDRYVAAITGEVNKETAFVLGKFGFIKPNSLASISGLSVILVDHNELIQAADGANEAKILEVVDHHKIDFTYSEPMVFESYPIGSTSSIIALKYFGSKLDISKELAGLLLSGILIDTVITKSPTCTQVDKDLIVKLAEVAEIKNWQEYGMELFIVRSQVRQLTATEIIKSDFKDFNFKAGKMGIGQVETVDLNEFVEKEEDLMTELQNLRVAGDYHSTILLVTDIIKEGSKILAATDAAAELGVALETQFVAGKAYVPGLISRKKQVIPKLTSEFDK